MLAGCAAMTAEQLCDHLLGYFAGDTEDDVVLAVVRAPLTPRPGAGQAVRRARVPVRRFVASRADQASVSRRSTRARGGQPARPRRVTA